MAEIFEPTRLGGIELDEGEITEVQTHLEGCAGCREELESLMAGALSLPPEGSTTVNLSAKELEQLRSLGYI